MRLSLPGLFLPVAGGPDLVASIRTPPLLGGRWFDVDGVAFTAPLSGPSPTFPLEVKLRFLTILLLSGKMLNGLMRLPLMAGPALSATRESREQGPPFGNIAFLVALLSSWLRPLLLSLRPPMPKWPKP